jgi:5-formyltetrahydrofolate cyclo-ligase
MTKAEIRTRIAERRATFSAESLKARSLAVLDQLRALEPFRTARTIGAYMPLAGEVDITPLLHIPEKTVYIPAFDEKAGLYRMARLTPELKPGRFGIPEPGKPAFASGEMLDLILVPGVAFDRQGGRIGRGGGFYDRILPLYRALRIGVCFDFQCLDRIPAEPHDCQMDWLAAETFILNPG